MSRTPPAEHGHQKALPKCSRRGCCSAATPVDKVASSRPEQIRPDARFLRALFEKQGTAEEDKPQETSVNFPSPELPLTLLLRNHKRSVADRKSEWQR